MQSSGRFQWGRTLVSLTAFLIFSAFTTAALAVGMAVSNMQASQRAGTQWADVLYDQANPDGVTLIVAVRGGSAGNVDGSDQYNHKIRKVTPARVVMTLAERSRTSPSKV